MSSSQLIATPRVFLIPFVYSALSDLSIVSLVCSAQFAQFVLNADVFRKYVSVIFVFLSVKSLDTKKGIQLIIKIQLLKAAKLLFPS